MFLNTSVFLWRTDIQKYFFLFVFCCCTISSLAQSKTVFISFADKQGTLFSLTNPQAFLSEKALERRKKQGIELNESDLPISTVYLESLGALGAKVLFTSKWLNGAMVEITDAQLAEILKLSFVEESQLPLGTLTPHRTSDEFIPVTNYGRSFRQLSMLDIDLMHLAGFRGEGIEIAIFDGGFKGADTLAAFQHLQFKSMYDFVDWDEDVFAHSDHGTHVLSVLASQLPNSLVGAAYKANYHLFRTEEKADETRLEEFNWLVAAEYADSIGVDIINSSLGYNLFVSEEDTYSQSQMDGQSAIITKAANLAFSKGMFIVSSVGNDGQPEGVSTLAAPADSPFVLSVGSVRPDGLISSFSSKGPTEDGRIKPDVIALGNGTVISRANGRISTSNGTSFAAPLVTGLVAGIWQAQPNLTNQELLQLIRESSSYFQQPDYVYGYGIPSFEYILDRNDLFQNRTSQIAFGVYPNPFQQELTFYSDQFLPDETVRLILTDLSGKRIFETESQWDNFQASFRLQSLQNGFYIGKFITQAHNEIIKIQKLE